jgi:hypothetical protein
VEHGRRPESLQLDNFSGRPGIRVTIETGQFPRDSRLVLAVPMACLAQKKALGIGCRRKCVPEDSRGYTLGEAHEGL